MVISWAVAAPVVTLRRSAMLPSTLSRNRLRTDSGMSTTRGVETAAWNSVPVLSRMVSSPASSGSPFSETTRSASRVGVACASPAALVL
jgi:hypothetical protein